MRLEDTTQLIQLILNSVLMMLGCALVLGRLYAREAALGERWRSLHRQWTDVVQSGRSRRQTWRLRLTQQVRHLQQRSQVVYQSVLVTQYALGLGLLSTLLLSVRLLLWWDWLVPLSLGCFVLGVGALLVGVGLMLLDFHRAKRPFWQEFAELLDVDLPIAAMGQSVTGTGRPSSARRDRVAQLRAANRARVS